MEQEEKSKSKKISYRVFLSTLCFVGLLFLILVLTWIQNGRLETLKNVRYLNANLVYDVSQSLDLYLEEKIASFHGLADSISGQNSSDSRVVVEKFLSRQRDFQEIVVMDGDYGHIVHRRQTNFLTTLDNEILKQRIKDSVSLEGPIGNFYWGTNDTLLLLIAEKIEDPVYGATILAAQIELDRVFDKMIALPTNLLSHLYILDKDGLLVAHNDISVIKKNLSYSSKRFFQNADTSKKIGLYSERGVSGEHSYISAFKYQPLDVVIAMETPKNIVFSWLFIPVFLSGVIFLLLIPFIFWVSSYIYRLFSKRSKNLQDSFEKVSNGDLFGAVKITNKDDFSDIEKGFNSMLESLQEQFQKIEEEKEFYKSSERLKGKLIEVVTKRLFIPLKTMKMDLETLLGGALGKFTSATNIFLRLIHRKNSNIISTVEDILLVDDIETGRYLIKSELTNLDIVTSIVIEELRGLAESKRLKIEMSRGTKLDAEVYVDSFKIKKVIFKLLSNAIKFSKEESVIKLKLSQKDHTIMFSITDQGGGMTLRDQERVFSKFFRAGNISLTHPEASGLSLYIAQKIIEAHNGKIWFESEEGKGTTFFFSLPVD